MISRVLHKLCEHIFSSMSLSLVDLLIFGKRYTWFIHVYFVPACHFSICCTRHLPLFHPTIYFLCSAYSLYPSNIHDAYIGDYYSIGIILLTLAHSCTSHVVVFSHDWLSFPLQFIFAQYILSPWFPHHPTPSLCGTYYLYPWFICLFSYRIISVAMGGGWCLPVPFCHPVGCMLLASSAYLMLSALPYYTTLGTARSGVASGPHIFIIWYLGL